MEIFNCQNGQWTLIFHKIFMSNTKDREVHFKCNIFFKKSKIERCISSVKKIMERYEKNIIIKNESGLPN